ncbi:MAG: deoxyribodipyrimidine photo-lyase [Myxococcota bacterium]|jgi:deoxyribodipyrimidine photo-lyase
MVPPSRIRPLNTASPREDAAYVLYWMVSARRTEWNHSLQHAAEEAERRALPLVIFEPLRCGYRWASARHHRFIIDGMRDNAAHLADRPVTYYPYIEPLAGAGQGLLAALASRAALVVTDDYPAFFLPRMLAAAADALDVPLLAVDSNGLLPLSATEAEKTTAHSFRRLYQKRIRPHIGDLPDASPLATRTLPPLGGLPADITDRWPAADLDTIDLSALPIDQNVAPVTDTPGGPVAAQARWQEFRTERLSRYHLDRNRVDIDGATGLSPYLHYGHIAVHQIFTDLAEDEGWQPSMLPEKATGSREGWWGMSAPAEAFIDELLIWRELGLHFCHHRPDYARYDSLPDWAQRTLAIHASDERPHTYTLEQLDLGQTHDSLWNACQSQLRTEGRIHNYLRMLWGKKILEWSPTPQDALDAMVELNNRYALDGRDPNSYSGIFWVLGRFDRAWGPERPIFGKIRFMSTASTRRKLKVKGYEQDHCSG